MSRRTSEFKVAELEVSYKPIHDRKVKITDSYNSWRVFTKMWDKNLFHIQEQFGVLFLNNANEVLGFRCLNTGTSTETIIDIKLMLSISCKVMATGIILAHNHPSGNTVLSKTDKTLTIRIRQATDLVGIQLIDHLILVHDGYVSMRDNDFVSF